ncbi:YueI family protein [Metabacillus sp. KUDC1714]|uniref:YueI family protein n=1 Tax=Metabacillus elymi TaxID=2745198 RepID=A0ABX6SGU5_9BACI|nr:YueI family protein [Metabacillus sp. KUDC1714]
MLSENIDDYIQQGIHGVREIKPDERRRFLGTLRERVLVVLTKQQVREKGTYIEVEELMKKNKEATLFLNGTMNYTYLSDYIKLANQIGTKFLISTNKEYDSELGLVLAYDYAINKEDIYIEKQKDVFEEEPEDDHHLIHFFKKLF